MTSQTNPRIREIQSIWQQYQGLYVVGGILIGLLLFPFLELLINDLSQLLIGLVPEAIGIGFTVFFLDRIYQKREIERLKSRLLREFRGRSNEIVKMATDWMREEGWLFDEQSLVKGQHFYNANLEKNYMRSANFYLSWFHGCNLLNADFSLANMQETTFFKSDLTKAILIGANFSFADFDRSELENASLVGANLEGARLSQVNLKGADLRGCNLKNAFLNDVEFDKSTILPDSDTKSYEIDGESYLDFDKTWTPETDMTRFTDPEHPDFWQPEDKS